MSTARLGIVALGLAATLACRTPDDGPCPWPEEPIAADGTVANGETCGYWLLTGGEQLIVALAITDEANPDCEVTMDDAVEMASNPIYSNFGDTGPQWTFAFRGVMATSAADIEILCDDGTEWHARVAVE